MRNYFLSVFLGCTLFFCSFSVCAVEKAKEEAIVRCMISGKCGFASVQGVHKGGLILIVPLVVNRQARVSLLLTPQGGLILNGFLVEDGLAIAVFDHDIDGVIDQVKISNVADELLQDRKSEEMNEEEKKLLQDFFDDVLKKVYDVLFPAQKKKAI
jgi:hypothetical protein